MADPAESFSFEDYLALELGSPQRHQLVDGQVWAMVGGTRSHARLCTALVISFAARLDDGSCEPYSSEARVWIEAATLATYPDFTVVCGPPESPPQDEDSTTNPTLVAEVLSPTTERFDRGRNQRAYLQLPSLRYYLLVSQDAVCVELYARLDGGTWTFRAFGPGETLPLPDLGMQLPVDELYWRVELGQGETSTPPGERVERGGSDPPCPLPHPPAGRIMPPSMLALVLLLLPTSSWATPWQEPVSVQDGADLDGPGWPVEPVPGRFSVTWAPGIEPSGPHDAPPSPARIEAGPYTLRRLRRISAPRYHTDAYELLGDAEPADVARALGRLPGVVVAGPLLQTGPGAWRAATDRLILQTRDDQATRRAAEALGLRWIGRRGLAPGQVELRVPAHLPLDPPAAAAALRARPEVRWAQVDWLQPQQERVIPDDPRFPEQWHLDNTSSNAGVEGNDLDAPEAWDVTMGRPDAIIAVLDSGVDLNHEDLADNLLPGFDFVDGVEGGATTGSTHGTRVSGVAAAPANGIGVVGVCPGCPILPGRVISASDADQAAAHDWAVERGAWVINDSWGPTDGTGQITPIAPVMAAAFESATTLGRGGLGTLIFWAAGNGNPADSCSMDGLVAHPLTIGVGASTDAGLRPNYSEMCPELELSSPSGGGSAGLTTTVVGGYTSGFGGTSAAAPGAAGSAALLLSAVPDLRWEDARALLHLSATKIDPEGADYDERGHSDGYGYGRVNPYQAMQGGLLLDHADEVVGCGASLGLRVVLPSMPGLGSVTATATASGDEEAYDLIEGGAGIYEGTIELSEAPPVSGDGLLSVTTLDTITVRSDQTANPASLEVRCGGPILRDPHVQILSPWAARLLWSTFDPSTGSAAWGAGDGERGEAPLGTIHRVWALALSPCTVYTADVDAVDTLGNTATWPGALTWTTPGDVGLVPGDAPSGADPCDPTTWQDDDDATPLFGDDDDTPAPGERPRFVAGPGCSCDGLQGALLLPLLGIRRRRRR